MTLDWAVTIILLGFGALGLFIKIYIKSTIAESIRHQFEVERLKMWEEFEREIHTIDRKDKFKLAALDKRLAAHQRAYTLAIKMIQTLRDTPVQKDEIIKKCETFWEEQNLFLSNNVRRMFQESLIFYQLLEEREKNADKHETKIRNTLYDGIEAADDKLFNLPSAIQKAVDLEPIEITQNEVKKNILLSK